MTGRDPPPGPAPPDAPPHSAPPGRSLVLDAAALDRLFPFHVCVDRELRVVRVGRVIDRLLPEWRDAPRLDALFAVERPGPVEDLAALTAAREQALILSATGRPGLRFKGEVLPLDAGKGAILLIVPWITDPGILERYRITVGDFAIGDATPDLIFMVETQAALIEDMRALTSRLQAARDAAVSASRAKSEFLANVSHELRTPLNAILGFSELLSTLGAVPEHRRADYAQTIFRSGSFLLDLVNDLLDLSRIEAGQMPFDESVFDVVELLREAALLFVPKEGEAGAMPRVEAEGTSLPVRGDRGMLRQVLVNLVGNAVKFNRPGGRVTLRHRLRADRGLDLEIEDTGIGIAPEVIPELFQPFRQANSLVARNYGGTGLGLHIVQKMVELHGGEVRIDSTPGVGTRVTVALPAFRVAAG